MILPIESLQIEVLHPDDIIEPLLLNEAIIHVAPNVCLLGIERYRIQEEIHCLFVLLAREVIVCQIQPSSDIIGLDAQRLVIRISRFLEVIYQGVQRSDSVQGLVVLRVASQNLREVVQGCLVITLNLMENGDCVEEIRVVGSSQPLDLLELFGSLDAILLYIFVDELVIFQRLFRNHESGAGELRNNRLVLGVFLQPHLQIVDCMNFVQYIRAAHSELQVAL